MTPADRENALRSIEADLIWLVLENRWDRARQILTDSEMQAAIRAANPSPGGGNTDGATAWSDPTGDAALSEAATEVRAAKILGAWKHELTVIAQHVQFTASTVAAVLSDDSVPMRASVTTPALVRLCSDQIRWMLLVQGPQNRLGAAVGAMHESLLDELDHSIQEARGDAKALRDGHLFTDGGLRIPSVFTVLEGARQAMRVERPPVEPPKQQPMQWCVSCLRGEVTSPIDVDRYNKHSLCRMCGDYRSANGELPPVGAIRHVGRTGKRLSWKIIEEAKRAERRAG